MRQLLSEQNFVSLSREVQALMRNYGWWEKHGHEWLFFGLRTLLFISGLTVFAQVGWVYKTLGMLVISYAFYGIAITGTHESRHNAFVVSARGNRLLGYFFGDFWSGESSLWWYYHHVQEHHVYTNIPGQDEDYFVFPKINKHVYFFLIPFFLIPALFWGSVKWLRGQSQQLAIFLILFATGYLLQTYLFSWFVSWPLALLCTLVMRSLYGPVFMHLALFNHIGLDRPDTKLPWLPHQTKTTRNVKPRWFLTGLGGNAFVHRHIEHHLFPSLSNRMLKKINPIVTKYVKKEGYLYIEETYWQCLKNCLRYYRQLFGKGPPPLMID